MDLRRPLPFALLVLAAFVVARWMAIAVHEVLGHGLFTVAAGGSFFGVYVSPVTGFTMTYLSPATPAAVEVLVDLAGILVDVLLGILLFVAYPRARTFVGRVFVLTLLSTLLVYSFAYLAMGVFGETGGDPAQVVAIAGAPHLAASLLVVGIAWSVVAGYAISAELVAVVGSSLSVRRQTGYLLLFWVVPLPVAAIPNAVVALFAPVALVTYAILVAAVAVALSFSGFRLSRSTGPSLPPMERSPGRLAPLAIALVLVLPAWFAFGLTSVSADRLLLSEPPLAAERYLANPQAINVRVSLTDAEDVILEFRMKGVPEPRSPLERQAFATFEDRADFSFWAPLAGLLGKTMMNFTLWNVSRTSIDPTARIWFDGRESPNPRVVGLELARPEEEPFFLQVSQNGTRTVLSLTLVDPFRNLPVECPDCFLDELNVTWPAATVHGSVVAQAMAADGGTPDTLVVDTGPARFARYRMRTSADAPLAYRLVIEVA